MNPDITLNDVNECAPEECDLIAPGNSTEIDEEYNICQDDHANPIQRDSEAKVKKLIMRREAATLV